ncbi:MAG: phage terminase small subunit P27 family [Acidobacteriaceae bacterium]|nr:phage terminase small subunit P27 family [Acidobacteriaceae bacterium]
MAGRKPKPTLIKELSGNPGKRRLNKSEPTFASGANCPSHLSEEAKKEWHRLSADLTASGLLTSVDRAALAAYCQSWATWCMAEQHLADNGYTITSPTGNVTTSPYVLIAFQAKSAMHKFAAEFGFTPSSRSRLNVTAPTKQKADPLDAFFDMNHDDQGLRQ